MPNFRVWFSGLCHFVENEDPRARCRVCVVIPKASDAEGRNDHTFKVSYSRRVQVKGRRVVDHDPGRPIGCIPMGGRPRITFQVRRHYEARPIGPVTPPGRDYVFDLREIVGVYADKDPSIVIPSPASSVAAQVLLEEGIFGYDENLSILRHWIVNDLAGQWVSRTLADPIYVEIPDVEEVTVLIEDMDCGDKEEVRLVQNDSDDFEIIVGSRCENQHGIKPMPVDEPPNRFLLIQVDEDFAFHYNLLEGGSVDSIVQERTKLHASAFAVPESVLIDLFTSPFLRQALEAPFEEPDPANAESQPDGSSVQDRNGSGSASENKTAPGFVADDTGVVETTLRSLVGAGGARSSSQWVEGLRKLEGFIQATLRSSGATCDCLSCHGNSRFFYLDRYLPNQPSAANAVTESPGRSSLTPPSAVAARPPSS